MAEEDGGEEGGEDGGEGGRVSRLSYICPNPRGDSLSIPPSLSLAPSYVFCFILSPWMSFLSPLICLILSLALPSKYLSAIL